MMMPEAAGVSSELARPAEVAAEAGSSGSAELQRTCVAVLRGGWSTLAVVATDSRTPALELVNALVDTARQYRLAPIQPLNGAGANSVQVARLMDAMGEARGRNARVAIAVDDPVANPARMPIVVAADAVLLLVRLGTSTIRSIEAMADLVGRDRIVGCVVVPS